MIAYQVVPFRLSRDLREQSGKFATLVSSQRVNKWKKRAQWIRSLPLKENKQKNSKYVNMIC